MTASAGFIAPVVMFAIIWLVTIINFLGARRVADFEGATLLIGLLPVLGVAVLGWFAFDPAVFAECLTL